MYKLQPLPITPVQTMPAVSDPANSTPASTDMGCKCSDGRDGTRIDVNSPDMQMQIQRVMRRRHMLDTLETIYWLVLIFAVLYFIFRKAA